MTEDAETITEISELELPYGRRVRLQDVDYHNGLHMLRIIWREGRRITVIDVDPASASILGDEIGTWAAKTATESKN